MVSRTETFNSSSWRGDVRLFAKIAAWTIGVHTALIIGLWCWNALVQPAEPGDMWRIFFLFDLLTYFFDTPLDAIPLSENTAFAIWFLVLGTIHWLLVSLLAVLSIRHFPRFVNGKLQFGLNSILLWLIPYVALVATILPSKVPPPADNNLMTIVGHAISEGIDEGIRRICVGFLTGVCVVLPLVVMFVCRIIRWRADRAAAAKPGNL